MTEISAEICRAPQCREHQILYGRLRADTRVYVDVIRRLESCKQEDFQKTYDVAQSARLAFLRARKMLPSTSPHIGANGNAADRALAEGEATLQTFAERENAQAH